MVSLLFWFLWLSHPLFWLFFLHQGWGLSHTFLLVPLSGLGVLFVLYYLLFFPPITNCVRKGKVSLCLWMTFGVSDSGNVNNLQQHFSRLEITRTLKRGAWKFVLRYWSPERGLFYPRIKSHGETSGRKLFALNCYTNGVKESSSVASVECIVTGHS